MISEFVHDNYIDIKKKIVQIHNELFYCSHISPSHNELEQIKSKLVVTKDMYDSIYIMLSNYKKSIAECAKCDITVDTIFYPYHRKKEESEVLKTMNNLVVKLAEDFFAQIEELPKDPNFKKFIFHGDKDMRNYSCHNGKNIINLSIINRDGEYMLVRDIADIKNSSTLFSLDDAKAVLKIIDKIHGEYQKTYNKIKRVIELHGKKIKIIELNRDGIFEPNEHMLTYDIDKETFIDLTDNFYLICDTDMHGNAVDFCVVSNNLRRIDIINSYINNHKLCDKHIQKWNMSNNYNNNVVRANKITDDLRKHLHNVKTHNDLHNVYINNDINIRSEDYIYVLRILFANDDASILEQIIEKYCNSLQYIYPLLSLIFWESNVKNLELLLNKKIIQRIKYFDSQCIQTIVDSLKSLQYNGECLRFLEDNNIELRNALNEMSKNIEQYPIKNTDRINSWSEYKLCCLELINQMIFNAFQKNIEIVVNVCQNIKAQYMTYVKEYPSAYIDYVDKVLCVIQ